MFDQGVLLGKVYCDDNGDGRQQRGERGLADARVFLDSGFYADADNDGQFHFSAIDPGLHLVKIDTRSLPPGSTLTTSRRALNVTRGLPVSIDFGVTCPDNSVTDVTVTPGDGALAEAERRRRERYTELEADLVAGALARRRRAALLLARRDDGRGQRRCAVHARARRGCVDERRGRRLWRGRDGHDDAARGGGARLDTERALVEPLAVRFEASDVIDRWILEVTDLRTNALVYVQSGRDVPSDALLWDGRDDRERMLLTPRGVYSARVRAVDAAGRYAESAPALVRVAETRTRYLVSERFSDVDMSQRRLDRGLLAELRALESQLASTAPNPVLVEAHLDDRDDADDEMEVTQSYANAVARFLVDQLGVERARITPTGYGVDRPIYPNIADRTRQTNRRVAIRVVDPEPEIRVPELPPAPLPVARVVANQRPLEADTRGRISMLVPKPADGLIALSLERPDGSVQGAFARVSGPSVPQPVLRAELPQVPVEIDLGAGTVRVGEAVSPLPGAGATLEAERSAAVLAGQRIEPVIRFRSSALPDGASWRFEVADGAGVVLWLSLRGAAPSQLRWGGRTSDGAPPAPGFHEARVIRLAGGGVVASAPARFELSSAAPSSRSRRRAAAADRARGRSACGVGLADLLDVRAEHDGQDDLVDVQTDARAIVPVSVPEGFRRALCAPLRCSSRDRRGRQRRARRACRNPRACERRGALRRRACRGAACRGAAGARAGAGART